MSHGPCFWTMIILHICDIFLFKTCPLIIVSQSFCCLFWLCHRELFFVGWAMQPFFCFQWLLIYDVNLRWLSRVSDTWLFLLIAFLCSSTGCFSSTLSVSSLSFNISLAHGFQMCVFFVQSVFIILVFWLLLLDLLMILVFRAERNLFVTIFIWPSAHVF